MPTPFAPYANFRALWQRPAAPAASLREGIRPATDSVVLEFYAKLQGPGGEQPGGGSIAIGAASITAYLTRWAVLPTGGNWLDAGTAWQWDQTGFRPAGLARGDKLQAWMGNPALLPNDPKAERGWFTIATMSCTGGIDPIVAAAAGEKFGGTFAAGR
jgi:hypothetical protein